MSGLEARLMGVYDEDLRTLDAGDESRTDDGDEAAAKLPRRLAYRYRGARRLRAPLLAAARR